MDMQNEIRMTAKECDMTATTAVDWLNGLLPPPTTLGKAVDVILRQATLGAVCDGYEAPDFSEADILRALRLQFGTLCDKWLADDPVALTDELERRVTNGSLRHIGGDQYEFARPMTLAEIVADIAADIGRANR
ncbi:hypothetical protein [Paraburkholderia sp. JPY419]|uniref:hypothetical protein n=1 Tax=Paraburkholderia sp. JPY419 TaxID=667660 RepID=UPI003D20BCD2